MERDPEIAPGSKVAFWVTLTLVLLVIFGTVFRYHIGYMYHSLVSPLEQEGPIDFHGQIVDPEGDPIPGAKLSAMVRVYRLLRGRSVEKRFEVESDENGNLRIEMRKGHLMHLSNFRKQGFHIIGRPAKFKGLSVDVIENWNFNFDPTSRDRTQTSFEDPFLFVMAPTKSP